MKPSRNLIPDIVLFLFSSALSVLLLETMCRLYLFGGHALSLQHMRSIAPLGADFTQRSPYKAISYELKPSLKAYFKLQKFETNSHGLRDKEYVLQPPADTFRVAVIGDSYTMPSGVAIEDAYHTLLEERLNAEQNIITYEFINFGVGGYSLKHYIGVLKHKVEKYRPDLILIGFCARNDHRPFPPRRARKAGQQTQRVDPFWEWYTFKLWEFVQLSWPESSGSGQSGGLSVAEERYVRQAFSLMRHMMDEQQAIPIVVAYLSNRPAFPQPVQRLASEQELFFVDTSAAFVNTRLADYAIYYPLDGHPNALAHKIFADRIYAFLMKSRLLGPRHTRQSGRFFLRSGVS